MNSGPIWAALTVDTMKTIPANTLKTGDLFRFQGSEDTERCFKAGKLFKPNGKTPSDRMYLAVGNNHGDAIVTYPPADCKVVLVEAAQ